MNLRYIVILVFLIVVASCKTDTTTAPPEEISAFQTAMEKLQSEPGKESAQLFVQELMKELAVVSDSVRELDLLIKGLNVAEEYKMGPAAIGFLMPLVKDFGSNPQIEDHTAKLASALIDIGKTIPGDILVEAYESSYPDGKYLDKLTAKQKENISDMDSYIKTLAENIFKDPDKYGVNKVAAQKYVDACEAYAIGFPTSDQAPVYLYRAAEMARTLKTYAKALSIFDWIEEKYPTYEKTPTTVFLKGFMLENELNNKEAARDVYNRFITKYPDSDLFDDVTFLLENIDKTDEEIMKMIDDKAAEKQEN